MPEGSARGGSATSVRRDVYEGWPALSQPGMDEADGPIARTLRRYYERDSAGRV